jgi:hypothetical protein
MIGFMYFHVNFNVNTHPMKRIFLTLFALLSLGFARAQGVFKAGAVVAFPVGDAGDLSSFGLGADLYYMFGHEDAWLNFGPTVGFRNYFGKDYEVGNISISADDAQFLPLAGAFRAKFMGLVNWGTDIGYAVGINDGNDGGFYFRPIVGLDIADAIEVNVSYENISANGGSWSAFTAGILFEFGQ